MAAPPGLLQQMKERTHDDIHNEVNVHDDIHNEVNVNEAMPAVDGSHSMEAKLHEGTNVAQKPKEKTEPQKSAENQKQEQPQEKEVQKSETILKKEAEEKLEVQNSAKVSSNKSVENKSSKQDQENVEKVGSTSEVTAPTNRRKKGNQKKRENAQQTKPVKNASTEVKKPAPKMELPKKEKVGNTPIQSSAPKETPKETVKEIPKVPKEISKETPKEIQKEIPKEEEEIPKETPKETPTKAEPKKQMGWKKIKEVPVVSLQDIQKEQTKAKETPVKIPAGKLTQVDPVTLLPLSMKPVKKGWNTVPVKNVQPIILTKTQPKVETNQPVKSSQKGTATKPIKSGKKIEGRSVWIG